MKTRRMLLRSLGALAVAGSLLSAGCEALGLGKDEDKDRGGDRISRPDRTGRGEADGGGRSSIADGARKVREGTGGERVSYRADRDGRLYALDVDADRVVYSGSVRRGDDFVLDPAANRADLNDRSVASTRISASHSHNLYFEPIER